MGGLLSCFPKKGFDPYWFAVALKRAEEFPDSIFAWDVAMIFAIDALQVKERFRNLSKKILDGLAR